MRVMSKNVLKTVLLGSSLLGSFSSSLPRTLLVLAPVVAVPLARAQAQGARANVPSGPPPVRIAVIPGGGSGMEQDVVDRITNELQNNPHVRVSTVNPDWFVQCNIFDRTDTVGASVRTNGTVVIKTLDKHILNTVSVQTNKQDFSITPGMPVNKALFDKSVREVIESLVERSRQPLAEAIDIEMDTRDKLIKAQNLGDDDKYSEALQMLSSVSQDSPHFTGARKLMDEFQMEQDAASSIKEGEGLARQGQLSRAVTVLRGVSPRSKRAGLARALIAKYRSGGPAPRSSMHQASPANSGQGAADKLKAIEAKKKALEAQQQALEAEEAELKKGK